MAEKNRQLQINHELISVLRSENVRLEEAVRTREISLKQSRQISSQL